MVFSFLQAVFALAITLGLIGAAAYAARRWGPSGMFQVKPAAQRRMAIVETLSLDPQRRLVLVRLDGEERLLLLGEGGEIGGPARLAAAPIGGSKSAANPAR